VHGKPQMHFLKTRHPQGALIELKFNPKPKLKLKLNFGKGCSFHVGAFTRKPRSKTPLFSAGLKFNLSPAFGDSLIVKVMQ